jgi:hypothetical protein
MWSPKTEMYSFSYSFPQNTFFQAANYCKTKDKKTLVEFVGKWNELTQQSLDPIFPKLETFITRERDVLDRKPPKPLKSFVQCRY